MAGPPSDVRKFTVTSRGGAYCASPCQNQNELSASIGGHVLVHRLLGFGVRIIEGSLGIRRITSQVGINNRSKLIPQGRLEGRYRRQDLDSIGGLNNIGDRRCNRGQLRVFPSTGACGDLTRFCPL